MIWNILAALILLLALVYNITAERAWAAVMGVFLGMNITIIINEILKIKVKW